MSKRRNSGRIDASQDASDRGTVTFDESLNGYIALKDSIVGKETEWCPLTTDQLERGLSLIPPEDADVLELYYRNQKTQKDIGKMLGVTQMAVGSRLRSAHQRVLRVLNVLTVFSPEDIQNLHLVGTVYRAGRTRTEEVKQHQEDRFCAFWRHNSYTRAGEELGVNWARIRDATRLWHDKILPYNMKTDPSLKRFYDPLHRVLTERLYNSFEGYRGYTGHHKKHKPGVIPPMRDV